MSDKVYPADERLERQDFEEAAWRNYLEQSLGESNLRRRESLFVRVENGHYQSPAIDLAWWGWWARAQR